MPHAIAGWIVTAIAGSAFAASTAGVIVTAVLTVAITYGMNAGLNALFAPARPKPSDGQQVQRQAVGSRKRHYGIVCTAGLLSFFESRNGTLAMTITLGTGEESEILEHKINDKVVSLDSAGTVLDTKYRGAIHVYTRLGSDDQTAISQLTAQFPEWTVNHRQRGCAHAAIICDPVKQKYFSQVYNSQMPSYTQTRKAVKLYDPRKDSSIGGTGSHRLADRSTWEWSDNAALVIADYFAHEDGYGGGYDNVNWANIAVEAAYADTTVTAVTGAVIARWRLWASYALASDERRQVMSDMQKACDAFIWQDANCKFNIKVGRYEAPTVTLTDDHIIALAATLGPKAQQRVDAVKMIYTEAATGYREQESATFGAPGVLNDPNTDPQAIEVLFAPHHNQAVRVGKINLYRLGNRWHITATTNLFGLNLIGERFCHLTSAQLGVDADFMVEGLKIDFKNMSIEASLSEVRASDWDFDASTEEGTPPIIPEESTEVPTVPVPTGLALTAVQITFGGANGVAIEAEWDEGRADLGIEVRYRPSAGGTWQMMAVDDESSTARSGAVDSGIPYEVQIRAVTTSYWASDWSAVVTITPVAATTVPPPIALSAVVSDAEAGDVKASFSMPSSAVAYARLYRNDENDFGSALQVGSDVVASPGALATIDDPSLAAGDYFYWARAFDGSGGSSALAGPVAVTVS